MMGKSSISVCGVSFLGFEAHCSEQPLANRVASASRVRAIGRRIERQSGPNAEPAQRFRLPLRRSVTHPGKLDQRCLSTERKVAQRTTREVAGAHTFARIALYAPDASRLVDREG